MKKAFSLAVMAFVFVSMAHAQQAQAFWFWNVSLENQAAVSGMEVRTQADAELIMKVETDAYPGISTFSVTRNAQGALETLVYLSRTDGDKTFTLEQLKKGPAVLKHSDGRDVVVLVLEKDFTAEKGGHAYVRFLQSGMSGTYRNFRILLDVQEKIILRSDPNPKDPESDDNSYTGVFNHVFMKKNTFLGKLIGIESVKPSMK